MDHTAATGTYIHVYGFTTHFMYMYMPTRLPSINMSIYGNECYPVSALAISNGWHTYTYMYMYIQCMYMYMYIRHEDSSINRDVSIPKSRFVYFSTKGRFATRTMNSCVTCVQLLSYPYAWVVKY